MIVFGSLLPWVMTPFGNLSGVRGAGLWTLCLGMLGIPGAVLRRRAAVLWHAVVVAAPAVVLPAWQLARLVELNLQAGTFGAAVPGIGLVLTFGGGALAGRAAWRLRA
ncbi:MAG: hypothetical protein GEU74_14795 [Nitriliruptorales bacterium]|nr:hypothetical protein [Nitriliruptorales bacterium]